MSARELARSFDDVAVAYERGRPRYEPHVIAAIGEAAVGPRLLDVGAGTGRLSGPLLQAGYDMVAVEPLDAMRAILASNIGPERALAGRAEALPLDDGSVDGAVCSDAWHWFDGARAADELHRVVRPGGGVVLCISQVRWIEEGNAPAWARETNALLDTLWQATDHPYIGGSRRPDGLEGHPGFEPIEVRYVPFVHHTDRDGMLAHYTSMSALASLPTARRGEALADLDAILARHGIDNADVPYRAELWVTRRRPGQAPLAGRRAAAS
jgi:SAM-dependent methyltransferase